MRCSGIFAVLLIAVLCEIDLASSKDGFIATIPQVLRHRTQSEFCMTMYNQDQSPKEAKLKLIESESADTVLELSESYVPGVQTCTKFEVPEEGKYTLLLVNDTSILHDSVEVFVQGDKPLILVQTDKPMYKPGQIVKFRVLTLLHNMKPRSGQIASIYISDPNDIRVKQFLNIDNDGLTSLEFQLVDRAKLGRWKIQVTLEEGSEPSTTTFEVKEYVLPRFEVTITPPSYILTTDELINGQVCAKYTYGKPVTGFLDLKVWWGQPDAYNELRSSQFTEVVEFSGCHNFTVNATQLISTVGIGYHYHPFYEELQISASVTETGTGAVTNKTHSGPRASHEPLSITMEDYTNGVFKPGLPFYGRVLVTKPDGTPASGEIIQITATNSGDDSRYSSNFTSDADGAVVYALCNSFTENTTAIYIDALAVEYGQEETDPSRPTLYTPRASTRIRQWFSPSLSYIQIPRIQTTVDCHSQHTLSIPFTTVANKDVTFTYQIMARGQVVKSGQVTYDHRQSYPGSGNIHPLQHFCLKWEEVTQPPSPPTPPTPPVLPDEEMTEFEAVLIPEENPEMEVSEPEEPPVSEYIEDNEDSDQPPPPPPPGPGIIVAPEPFIAPIVRSEVVSDTTASFILDFPVSTLMSPSFTLLVYHVLPDGEVAADSMDFKVNPCFANDVDLDFDKETAVPGEDVSLSLSAAPGSLCGVGVVDKSVNILGGNHQITREKVFQRIEELSRAQFPYMPRFYMHDDDYCKEMINRLSENPASPDEFWFYTSPFVDAIQAFKSSGFRVLTNLDVETRPCERSYPIFYASVGEEGGNGAEMIPRRSTQINLSEDPKIRSDFPESWLWDLVFVGEEGQTTIEETAPDTITSWVGNALCLNEEQGFGVSEIASLTTFQPFFVSLQLPYSAVRGERLPAILTIYNYLDKCINTKLSFDVGADITLSGANENQQFCLCAGESKSVRYYVTPENIGSLNITAKAKIIPGICDNAVEMDTDYLGYIDGVRRQLLVKAEGTTQEYTHTSYVCSKRDDGVIENVILPLPEDMVKDSARGEIKVIGDIMGPAMTNLDSLVRMPTGCGEQNMVGFVPNILVLKYLANTGRLTDKIEVKATKHMEIGYQRELTYRHRDGSYSAFGESDENGSVWLTAFVVKSFSQAKPYIFVDEEEIDLSITFLRRSQLENGCFRETGKVLSSFMMGGLGKSKNKESFTAITAYVLTALLQAGVSENESIIIEGMKCINRDFRSSKGKMDPYTMALVAYVNTMYKPLSQESSQLIKALDAKSIKKGSLRYWSRETQQPPSVNTWYYHAAPSAEVEMTSYALLAYLNFYGERAVAQTHDIAMWLSQQRNPQGGFSSTQDTVVGLQALSEFAALAYNDEGSDLIVKVSGEKLDSEFRVSEDLQNTLLLQSAPIQQLPNELRIETTGVGCALIQATVSYNKPPETLLNGIRPPFYVKVMEKPYQHDIDRCDRRTLKLILRLRTKKFSTGMSIVSIKMVTSWKPVEDSLLKLKSQFPLLGIKLYEYKEEEGLLIFYFDELTRRPKELSIDVEQNRDMKVSSTKPAEVKVYQYYETDVAVVKSYELKTTCGTKEEIPRLKIPEVYNSPEGPVQVRIDLGDAPRMGAARSRNPGCPVCSASKTIPDGLDNLVCNSVAIYKAVAGRNGKKPLKLRQDLRPLPEAKNMKIFANYNLPAGCDCSMMKAPKKRVFIFTKRTVNRRTVSLDDTSVVLPSTRKLEREIKKARRTCANDS